VRFYTKQHPFYCGIDLQARPLYGCILDQDSEVMLHRNTRASPETFPTAVECRCPGYWLADLGAQEGSPFALGHARYRQAIHGGTAKPDTIDAHKMAVWLRGGVLPQAYVYPADMRATRDLLRRRLDLTRKRAEVLAHLQNTDSQCTLPAIGTKPAYRANRHGAAERFPDRAVRKSTEGDLALLGY
jgi:hypothetical protein